MIALRDRIETLMEYVSQCSHLFAFLRSVKLGRIFSLPGTAAETGRYRLRMQTDAHRLLWVVEPPACCFIPANQNPAGTHPALTRSDSETMPQSSAIDTTINSSLSRTYLQRVPLFQGMTDENMDKVMELIETVEYPKHRVVVETGDVGDSMFVILAGSLEVYHVDPPGKKIVFAILRAGDYFGEMSLIDGKGRSAAIATLEPSMLLRLGKSDFDLLIDRSPEFRHHLLMGLCQRLRQANSKITSLAHMHVYGRVAALLMECSEPCGDHYIVRDHLTHQDIADRIGSSREMVSKILRDLLFGRYISYDEKKKHIVIHKQLPDAW